MKQKTLVYEYLSKKNIFAERQSNQTLLVKKGKLPDSDQLILEDKYGHRYGRDVSMEMHRPGYMYFYSS